MSKDEIPQMSNSVYNKGENQATDDHSPKFRTQGFRRSLQRGTSVSLQDQQVYSVLPMKVGVRGLHMGIGACNTDNRFETAFTGVGMSNTVSKTTKSLGTCINHPSVDQEEWSLH